MCEPCPGLSTVPSSLPFPCLADSHRFSGDFDKVKTRHYAAMRKTGLDLCMPMGDSFQDTQLGHRARSTACRLLPLCHVLERFAGRANTCADREASEGQTRRPKLQLFFS